MCYQNMNIPFVSSDKDGKIELETDPVSAKHDFIISTVRFSTVRELKANFKSLFYAFQGQDVSRSNYHC